MYFLEFHQKLISTDMHFFQNKFYVIFCFGRFLCILKATISNAHLILTVTIVEFISEATDESVVCGHIWDEEVDSQLYPKDFCGVLLVLLVRKKSENL